MKTCITFFILLFAATIALSQFRGGERPPKHIMERIENYKKVRLMESLKLDEALTIKFFARYDKHRKVIRGVEKERGELVDKLELQVQNNANDADYNQSFSAIVEIDKKIFEARKIFLSELKEILSAKQIAEYIIFEKNFAEDLRETIRDVQKERMRDR